MALYLTSRYENAELLIYNENDQNPINFLSLVEGEIRIENTDPFMTGLWKQEFTVRIENKIASPVWKNLADLGINVGNTYNILRRNRNTYIKAGNRVRLLYPKTNGVKVCVFEGRIFRFVSQGARFIEFICGCALTFLDTEKPANNYAESNFDGTLTMREALNNIIAASGWTGGVDYSQIPPGALEGEANKVVIEIQKDENEPIITHAGIFLKEYCVLSQNKFYYLWHNPRTNTIQVRLMDLSINPSRFYDDKVNMNSEDVAQLDIASSVTVGISTFNALKPLGEQTDYCVTSQSSDDNGVTTITVCYIYESPYRKKKVTTITEPILDVTEQSVLDLWLPTKYIGHAHKTITETEFYGCDGYLWKKLTVTTGDFFYGDGEWYYQYLEYYGLIGTLSNSDILEVELTVYTYTDVAGEVDHIYTILQKHPIMLAYPFGDNPDSRTSRNLMLVQEDFTAVKKKSNGYEIRTWGYDWTYDTYDAPNPVKKVIIDSPTFQTEPLIGPQVEKIVFIDGVAYLADVSANQLGARAIGTNPDVNPYLPTEEEINFEFANTQDKVSALTALHQRFKEGREFLISVELDASDNMLDTWQPCECYELTHLFLTEKYFAMPSLGFTLSRTRAAFLGEFLKYIPEVTVEPLSFGNPDRADNGRECPYPPPEP